MSYADDRWLGGIDVLNHLLRVQIIRHSGAGTPDAGRRLPDERVAWVQSGPQAWASSFATRASWPAWANSATVCGNSVERRGTATSGLLISTQFAAWCAGRTEALIQPWRSRISPPQRTCPLPGGTQGPGPPTGGGPVVCDNIWPSAVPDPVVRAFAAAMLESGLIDPTILAGRIDLLPASLEPRVPATCTHG